MIELALIPAMPRNRPLIPALPSWLVGSGIAAVTLAGSLPMMKRIAIVCCVSLLIQTTVAAADPGPLLKASLRQHPEKLFRAARPATRTGDDNDNQATSTWMERHPVWTGALVGFSAGFLLTYAVAASEDRSRQLLTPVDPGGPALVWGGIAAGVGALAGWGIGRSRDKNPNSGPDSTASAVENRVSTTDTTATAVVEQLSKPPRN